MISSSKPQKIMIAGIGGASLGTELFKALQLAGGYEIFGCDISATAYGLYMPGFTNTYHINQDDYISHVIDACNDSGAKWIVPGGEQPMILLGKAALKLSDAGINLLSNEPSVISLFSDKEASFQNLALNGIPAPRTISIVKKDDIECIGLPCIVKPATGSGGSDAVFYSVTVDEAMTYAEFIRRNGRLPIAQEYVDVAEGEFTIGVLSLPDKRIAGSIALRRDLNAKLSISYRGRGGLISSGYSQGYIAEFKSLCSQAEHIAKTIGSRGPINVQGRVRDGVLLPFEINPRFSASTFLRALAGFNEVDILIKFMHSGILPERQPIQFGWYLRSLTETFVSESRVQ